MNGVTSRPAKIGDRLVTTGLTESGFGGFAAVEKPDVAVRLMPGTELVFDETIQYYHRFSSRRFCVDHKIAKFREFRTDDPNAKCDALELLDGRIVMVTELAAGQTATVRQLPPSARSESPP